MSDDDQIYDLCIIGGGINGAGIANYASSMGLKVYLCEQGDFAGKTSSNSTKLIHGGLRYLEFYEFSLVRKALKERIALEKIAPHIIWPMGFILINNPNIRNKWLVRLGLFVYDMLAGFSNRYPKTKTVNIGDTKYSGNFDIDKIKKELFKEKSKDKIIGFTYSDLWVDDARLTLLNVMQADKNGAVVKRNTECTSASFEKQSDLWRVNLKTHTVTSNIKERNNDNDFVSIKTRLIINASGPWVNEIIENQLNLKAKQEIRLVRGSHIVVPKLYNGLECYVLQHNDNRIIFTIPYEKDYTLIGTTEVECDTDILYQDKTISDQEVAYLCEICNKFFNKQLNKYKVVWSYTGIRPLVMESGSHSSKNTRDYLINSLYYDATKKIGPVINVYGGKITTYRSLAKDVIKTIFNKYQDYLQIKTRINVKYNPKVFAQKLPGYIVGLNRNYQYYTYLKEKYPWLDDTLAQRYSKTYGGLADIILSGCNSMIDLGYHYGAGLYNCEVEYLLHHEYVTSVDDIIWRRTKLGLAYKGEIPELRLN